MFVAAVESFGVSSSLGLRARSLLSILFQSSLVLGGLSHVLVLASGCCYCFSIEDCSSAFNTVISTDLGFNVGSRRGLCAGFVIVFALDDG